MRRLANIATLALALASPWGWAADAPAGAATVYLRDGRRISCEQTASQGRRLVLQTRSGTLSVPAWMVAGDPAVGNRWALLDDAATGGFRLPELLAQRRTAATPPSDVSPEDYARYRDWVEDLIQEQDLEGLLAMAGSLDQLLAHSAGDDASRWESLRSRTYREAGALLAKADNSRASAFVAARFYQNLYMQRYPDSAGIRPQIAALLAPWLRDDPPLTATLTAFLQDSELYAELAAALANDDWRYTGRQEAIPEGLCEFYRVTHSDGNVEWAGSLPSSHTGIATVEAATIGISPAGTELTTVGTPVASYTQWLRLFWCPVSRRWCETTVPMRLDEQRRQLYVLLARLLDAEARDVGLMQSQWQGVEHLANVLGRDPRGVGSTAGIDPASGVRQLAARGQELTRLNNRCLQRRLYMQRAFAELERTNDNFRDACAGIAPAAPPAAPANGQQARTAAAFVAAFAALDHNVHAEALANPELAPMRTQVPVRDALLALLQSPFEPAENRLQAARVLRTWGDSRGSVWLFAALAQAADAEEARSLLNLIETDPSRLAQLALDRQGSPVLLAELLLRLKTLAGAGDTNAVRALAACAAALLLPETQVRAVETIGELRQFETLGELALTLRYPCAREAARRLLAAHDSPLTPALDILAEAQREAESWLRQKRWGPPVEEGSRSEDFRQRFAQQLTMDQERAIRATASGTEFMRRFFTLLDPCQLHEDQLLQQLCNSSNVYALRLAELENWSGTTRTWVQQLAALPQLAGSPQFQGLLIAQGDENTLKPVLATLRSEAASARAKSYTLALAAFARDPHVAEAVLPLLDDPDLGDAALAALRRITGDLEKSTRDDWLDWAAP